MQEKDRINYLFEKYINNNASKDEISELFESIKYFSDHNNLDTELFSLWNNLQQNEAAQQPNWDKLYSNSINQKSQSKLNQKFITPKLWYYSAAAAAIAVIITVASLFHAKTFSSSNLSGTNYITYTVPYNHTKTILFADGSKATLNAGTTIKYPKVFTSKTREVNLNGEAYFEIHHMVNKPFIVQSGLLKTQVLGTSFNVKAYKKATSMKITVVTGKVAVQEATAGRLLMLTPNQQAVFNIGTAAFNKVLISDAENSIAWRNGKLVFEDASMDEITTDLSLRFGVKITMDNPQLRKCRISAVFQNKSLTQILNVITRITKSTYTIHNNIAEISGKGCNDN
ncbi:FecR family protein [Mucilaginibacter polytrichastri]|uniref:FecR protein domain-containing protein n=1 Tax=Mucilaginibacter polytrichastri TaxID=1302689 RepID=A0A1Q6A0E1_9SPHI|nr:FecR domain-containing protein [Mucilaginibacter polytrichastri]OKS87473.1 hypothetical protein RG47T_2934 [Mucilaginibacter polytrichastri]SFS91065.1 FecR family protein [Mucilaginibacter polytrichastri]